MSFATGQDVMRTVESLVTELLSSLNAEFTLVERDNDIYPVSRRGQVRAPVAINTSALSNRSARRRLMAMMDPEPGGPT